MIFALFPAALAAEVTTPGEARLVVSLPPDVVVDAEGTSTDQTWTIETRVRLGARVALTDRITARTEWDMLSGQMLGDTWAIAGEQDERMRQEYRARTIRGIQPRQLAIGGRTGKFDVEAGLVTSHWGLGLVANDGAHDPLFGRADFGDRTFRLRAATAPWMESKGVPLVVLVATDFVVADEFARLGQGQLAFQGIAAARMQPKDGPMTGVYAVYRAQRERDGRGLSAGVIDGTFDVPVTVGEWTGKVAGEGALIFGSSTLSGTYNARDGVAVNSGGAALQGVLTSPDERVATHLRAGVASGDADPDDGTLHDFGFDRDYDVGMLLFDERSGALEAGLSALVSDPKNSGQPPDGYETLTTEGSFRRASYVQPAVVVQAEDRVEVRAGVVMAWSTAPQTNGFYTARAGGSPRNARNEPTSGYGLGTEFDWAVRLHGGEAAAEWSVQPDVLVQGAHATLTEAAAGSGDRTLHLVTGIVRARW